MEGDPNETQRADSTIDRMMDMERSGTRRRKGWIPWKNLGQVAGIDDFYGTIWDKGREEVKRFAWRLVKDKNVCVEAGEDWVTNLHTKFSWFTNMRNVLLASIGDDREYYSRISLGEVQMGPGDAMWSCNQGATSCRSVILFTGPIIGVLILVHNSPIWKCEYSWESRELFQDVFMVWLIWKTL